MADLKARAEREGRTYSNLARLLIIRSMRADRDSCPSTAT
ncbi:ribbon-helix-helix domain-containing protein [Ralstonia holmesii]